MNTEQNVEALLRQLLSQQNDIGDVKFASSITGYKQSTLYVFVNKKEIPFIKKRGKLLFSRTKLLEWLLSGEKQTRAEIAESIPSVLKRRTA